MELDYKINSFFRCNKEIMKEKLISFITNIEKELTLSERRFLRKEIIDHLKNYDKISIKKTSKTKSTFCYVRKIRTDEQKSDINEIIFKLEENGIDKNNLTVNNLTNKLKISPTRFQEICIDNGITLINDLGAITFSDLTILSNFIYERLNELDRLSKFQENKIFQKKSTKISNKKKKSNNKSTGKTIKVYEKIKEKGSLGKIIFCSNRK